MDNKLYSKIKNRIRYSKQITINSVDAEDLTHDTLLKLYEKDIKNDDDCLKLCVIVAKNILIDNKRKLGDNVFYNDLRLWNIPDNTYNKFEFKEPIKYRTIYILRYKLDMSLKEIAEALEIPINTIKGHHIKMKKEFRELNNL